MNATACERVAQFALNYTPKNFNYLCAQRQNSKFINCMDKIKVFSAEFGKQYDVNKKK